MKITHVLLNNGQLGKISKGAARERLGGLASFAAQPWLLEVRTDGALGIRVNIASQLR